MVNSWREGRSSPRQKAQSALRRMSYRFTHSMAWRSFWVVVGVGWLLRARNAILSCQLGHALADVSVDRLPLLGPLLVCGGETAAGDAVQFVAGRQVGLQGFGGASAGL